MSFEDDLFWTPPRPKPQGPAPGMVLHDANGNLIPWTDGMTVTRSTRPIGLPLSGSERTAAAAASRTVTLGKGNDRVESEVRAQTEDQYRAAIRRQIERIPPHHKFMVAICKAALDEPTVHPQAKIAIIGLLEHFQTSPHSGAHPDAWNAIPPLPVAEVEAMKKEDKHWLTRAFKWVLSEMERWSKEGIFWDDPR